MSVIRETRERLLLAADERAKVVGLELAWDADYSVVTITDPDAPGLQMTRELMDFQTPAWMLHEAGLLEKVTFADLGFPTAKPRPASAPWVALTIVDPGTQYHPDLMSVIAGQLLWVDEGREVVRLDGPDGRETGHITDWSRELPIPCRKVDVALEEIVEVARIDKRDCGEHSQFFDVHDWMIGCPSCGGGVRASQTCRNCGMLRPCECDVRAASLGASDGPPDVTDQAGQGWTRVEEGWVRTGPLGTRPRDGSTW